MRFKSLVLALSYSASSLFSQPLDDEVGQLFVVYFEGREANEESQRLLAQGHVGGFILYNWANGLDSPEQVAQLTQGLQNQAKELGLPPLLIAVDQEGGLVARLREGFSSFPGNAALGRTAEPELAKKAALQIAQELRAVGCNFNFAPVVDVNCEPENPIIGIRSFGDDPKLVSDFGRKALQGYAEGGILACLKHFPGHGDVLADSHYALPIVDKSVEKLEAVEFAPFRTLLDEAPAIMTAHLILPHLDAKKCASLSRKILQGLLRESWGFEGVIVADSLVMRGALECAGGSLENCVLEAFQAGNDVLLIGGRDLQNQVDGETHVDEILRIQKAFRVAIHEGVIPKTRVDESLRRISKLKGKISDCGGSSFPGTFEELSRRIALRSIEYHGGGYPKDLGRNDCLLVFPELLRPEMEASLLSQIGKSCKLQSFVSLEPEREEFLALEEAAEKADLIVFCSYNAWKNPSQEALLKQLAEKKPTVFLAVRDVADVDLLEDPYLCLSTLNPGRASLSVVAELLGVPSPSLVIEDRVAQILGQKIFHNECSSREDLLLFWSPYEDFPSLGIGHFIWPPHSYRGAFKEGRFHHFLDSLQAQGYELPLCLGEGRYCPWPNREAFLAAQDGPESAELRHFLLNTMPEQARYMAQRLEEAIPRILKACPAERRLELLRKVDRLEQEPLGIYVLVDYLNFKHEGVASNERYQGQGWGLLQVLLEMDEDPGLSSCWAFAEAAEKLLKQRIANAPHERNEGRWLLGWQKRLGTYLST